MGRLSTFAKNRILNLRFQKSFRIKQIAQSLQQEDNIKVSRKSVSTFLKKYIETKSIDDKPRSGRNKKLTPEEINLIGEITRLNRDITAPKIKEYLNLNVSTYTILRASKLFEWNKLNPNSNEAKKAAALERQLNGEVKKRRTSQKTKLKIVPNDKIESNDESIDENINPNLNLISEQDILEAKNASSSPMVFATKILYKIFDINELLGHNVSGKTFNRYIKNKKALDEKRILYIKWIVETYYETDNKEEQWKACRTAINKSIRNNEIKGFSDLKSNDFKSNFQIISLNESEQDQLQLNLEPNMSIFQMTNDLDTVLNKIQINPMCETSNIDDNLKLNKTTSIVRLTDPLDTFVQNENNSFLINDDQSMGNNLNILTETEILELKGLYCSPMIFATKVLMKLFSKEELLGHNIGGKTFHKNSNQKEALDETRINYIKWMIDNYFNTNEHYKQESVWKSCRKAINRVIRNFEIKESKLIKSIDENNSDTLNEMVLDLDSF